jgi:hypothetical protein
MVVMDHELDVLAAGDMGVNPEADNRGAPTMRMIDISTQRIARWTLICDAASCPPSLSDNRLLRAWNTA